MLPDYLKFGLGQRMIDGVNKPIKKVIFQTRKEHPPSGLFYHIAERIKKIHENQEMITWEMDWESTHVK